MSLHDNWGETFFANDYFPWLCRICKIEGESLSGYQEHLIYHFDEMARQPSLEDEQAAAVAEAELILNEKV